LRSLFLPKTIKQQPPQVKINEKEKSPDDAQIKVGLLRSMFMGTLDPRSPSTFVTRTPIQILRSISTSKFNHQELMNDSLNESVDIDILTAEEQESLDSNKDLVDAINVKETKEVGEANNEDKVDDETLPDPRSPTTEIARTPIVPCDEVKKNDTNLIKKLADKLIATKISNGTDDSKTTPTTSGATKKKSKNTQKNLIYEDDEAENFDRFSTPPKKTEALKENERTPLSCVANRTRNALPKMSLTSTPKGSKIPVSMSRESASRIPRRIE
jgi:hypothetical protein